MVDKKFNKSITVNGLIIPAQWDKHGNIKGIAIAGFDETNYPILMDKVGRSLLVQLHKEVAVSAEITKINNSDVIRVKKFQLTKSP